MYISFALDLIANTTQGQCLVEPSPLFVGVKFHFPPPPSHLYPLPRLLITSGLKCTRIVWTLGGRRELAIL